MTQRICFNQRYGTWFVLSIEPLIKGTSLTPPREKASFVVEGCLPYSATLADNYPYRWKSRLRQLSVKNKFEGSFVGEHKP